MNQMDDQQTHGRTGLDRAVFALPTATPEHSIQKAEDEPRHNEADQGPEQPRQHHLLR